MGARDPNALRGAVGTPSPVPKQTPPVTVVHLVEPARDVHPRSPDRLASLDDLRVEFTRRRDFLPFGLSEFSHAADPSSLSASTHEPQCSHWTRAASRLGSIGASVPSE